MAREALRKVGRGVDPAEERKAAQEAATDPDTVAKVTAEFIQRYAKPKNRSWKETERIFERYVLPEWGKRPIENISRRDVIALLDSIMDQGSPYMANRVLANIRRFFNWCLERDILQATPVAKVKALAKEVSRDRILSDDEVRAVWRAWDAMGWPFGLAFKFLLVTGQRLNEVSTMRWSDANLENRLWTLPREFTKSDRLHEVPLSPLAVEILEAVPNMGEFVFTTNGKTPISGFSKAKKRCDDLSGVRQWRLHDLRRTAASGMARLSIAPHVVEKVLNHASGTISGVAAVYNRHGYTDEKRAALNTWARTLEGIIRPTEGNVIPLESRQER
jgi:integrase